VLPSLNQIKYGNYCSIGFVMDERTGRLIVISALDNLVKGASGQAVQNMNIMAGLPESTGLKGQAHHI
jgi:N-acetyl-gamma-glutamyl-phosphate reductase